MDGQLLGLSVEAEERSLSSLCLQLSRNLVLFKHNQESVSQEVQGCPLHRIHTRVEKESRWKHFEELGLGIKLHG